MAQTFDSIIVGGGPAGMTAALYLARAGKSVLIVEGETFGGQVTHSPKIENYPGFIEMSGAEFAEKLLDQIDAAGVEIAFDTAVAARKEDGLFVVTCEMDGDYLGRSLIAATGVKHRALTCEGAAEFEGNGISYCAVCDGAFYAGRDVCVVGGGNSALQEALMLAETSHTVTLVHRRGEFRSDDAKLIAAVRTRANIELALGYEVAGVLSEGTTFLGLELAPAADAPVDAKPRELRCDGAFVSIGLVPANDAFAELAELSDAGYFDAGESCATRTPGFFVAGDCRTKALRQITTAVADGAQAAIAACRYLQG